MTEFSTGMGCSKVFRFPYYRFRILLGAITFVMVVTSLVHGKAWRRITPLHSDRAYVERLLGKPTMDNGDTVVYDYATERASIEYSKEPCSAGNIWSVPRDRVISIWVTPKTSHLTASTFVLNPSRYKRLRDAHVLNIIHYTSERDGVEYNVDENTGAVVQVKYLPTANDNHLRCLPPMRVPVTKSGDMIDSHALFDSYGWISFASEKQRLDAMGGRLRELLNHRGIIVVHEGRGISVRQGLTRANRSRNYLIRKFKLPDSSVEIIQGDPMDQFRINLYLLP